MLLKLKPESDLTYKSASEAKGTGGENQTTRTRHDQLPHGLAKKINSATLISVRERRPAGWRAETFQTCIANHSR